VSHNPQSNIESTSSGEASGVSRRNVLCGALLAGLGLSIGALPERADAATGIKVLPNKKIQVTLSAYKQLAKVGGSIILPLNDGSELGIVRTKSGVNGFAALSLTCPHNFATVNEVGNQWVCPAHGSTFALDGKLEMGPARQGLSPYPIKATAKYLTIG